MKATLCQHDDFKSVILLQVGGGWWVQLLLDPDLNLMESLVTAVPAINLTEEEQEESRYRTILLSIVRQYDTATSDHRI